MVIKCNNGIEKREERERGRWNCATTTSVEYHLAALIIAVRIYLYKKATGGQAWSLSLGFRLTGA